MTDEVRPLAQLTGGIIGAADLTACLLYRTPAGFAVDAGKHGNAGDWFQPPRMYGFVFRAASPVPYRPCKGSVRFFTVELPEAG